MGDLELDLLLDLGRHFPLRFIHILRYPVEQIKIDNDASQGCVGYQLTLVIPSEVENGASGTSEMGGCAARVAARESGDQRVKSLDVSLNESAVIWR